jgi:hypothetical protein
MAIFLILLLLILTFNAYACILPLQTATQMDCSSGTGDQGRQTCDAFLEMGPHSQFSSNHAVSSFTLEDAVPIRLLGVFLSGPAPGPIPRGAGTPIHLSIPTTVLRI